MRRSIQQNLPPMPLVKVREGSCSGTKSLQDWQGVVDVARARAHLSQKLMAADMGISQQQLSDQLAGRDGAHLSFWRMFGLPPAFWQELVLLIIEFYDLQLGLSEIDRRDLEFGRSLREMLQRSGR
jgi:hypothetical protein